MLFADYSATPASAAVAHVAPAPTRSFEILCTEGSRQQKNHDAARWSLGDLACEVETGYGDKALDKFAQRLGEKVERIREYRRVARAFPNVPHPTLRRPVRELGLTWSIYSEAAGQPDALAWIEKALSGEWTVAEMRSQKAYAKDTDAALRSGRPCMECEEALPKDPIHVRFDGKAASFCSWSCVAAYAREREREESLAPPASAMPLAMPLAA